MHRDVSAGNLLILPRIAARKSNGSVRIWWRGLLADWELAKHTDVKIALQPRRTVCLGSNRVWYCVSDLFLRAPGTSCPRTSSTIPTHQQRLPTNLSRSCTFSSTVPCAGYKPICGLSTLSCKTTSLAVTGTLRPIEPAALMPSGSQSSRAVPSPCLAWRSDSQPLESQQNSILLMS